MSKLNNNYHITKTGTIKRNPQKRLRKLEFIRTSEVYADCPKCGMMLQYYSGLEDGDVATCEGCGTKYKAVVYNG